MQGEGMQRNESSDKWDVSTSAETDRKLSSTENDHPPWMKNLNIIVTSIILRFSGRNNNSQIKGRRFTRKADRNNRRINYYS